MIRSGVEPEEEAGSRPAANLRPPPPRVPDVSPPQAAQIPFAIESQVSEDPHDPSGRWKVRYAGTPSSLLAAWRVEHVDVVHLDRGAELGRARVNLRRDATQEGRYVSTYFAYPPGGAMPRHVPRILLEVRSPEAGGATLWTGVLRGRAPPTEPNRDPRAESNRVY